MAPRCRKVFSRCSIEKRSTLTKCNPSRCKSQGDEHIREDGPACVLSSKTDSVLFELSQRPSTIHALAVRVSGPGSWWDCPVERAGCVGCTLTKDAPSVAEEAFISVGSIPLAPSFASWAVDARCALASSYYYQAGESISEFLRQTSRPSPALLQTSKTKAGRTRPPGPPSE